MTGPLQPWIDEARAALEEAASVWKPLAETAPELERALERLMERAERLETPLVIVLTGGTGAGKSTLLNALAGHEIARTGARRPTTTELTIYHHRDAALLVPPALVQQGRAVAHERAGLRDKVLVDAPDFDSSARSNRERLAAALASADMALVVASPEKYVAAELFEWLRALRSDHAFAFVLTHYDLLDPAGAHAIASDLALELERAGFEAPRVFKLSATEAARARSLGKPLPAQAGEFEALEAWIERELTRTRVRRLKEANLLRMARTWLVRARKALPADRQARLEALELDAKKAAAEAAAAVVGRLQVELERDAALLEALWSLHLSAIGGPTGFYLALRHTLTRLLQPAATVLGMVKAPVNARPFAALAATADDAETLRLAALRIRALGAERGLTIDAEPPEHASTLARAVNEARNAGEKTLAHVAAKPVPLANTLANFAPLGVFGFGLWRWLEAAIRGAPALAPGWLEAVVLFTVIVTVLSAKATERWARGRARRTHARLITALEEAAARPIMSDLIAPVQSAIEVAERGAERLEQLDRQTASDVAQAVHRQTPSRSP